MAGVLEVVAFGSTNGWIGAETKAAAVPLHVDLLDLEQRPQDLTAEEAYEAFRYT